MLAIGVGLFVLYAGVAELLTAARDRKAKRAEIGRRDLMASFAPVAVGAVAFGAVVLFLATGGTTAPAVVRSAVCNGHIGLARSGWTR